VLVASSGGAGIGVDLLRQYSKLFTAAIVSEPPIFRLDPQDGGRQIMKDLQPPLAAAFRRASLEPRRRVFRVHVSGLVETSR
jgi:hypothetical protein